MCTAAYSAVLSCFSSSGMYINSTYLFLALSVVWRVFSLSFNAVVEWLLSYLNCRVLVCGGIFEVKCCVVPVKLHKVTVRHVFVVI